MNQFLEQCLNIGKIEGWMESVSSSFTFLFSQVRLCLFFFISFNIYFTFAYQVKLEEAIEIDIVNGKNRN